MSLIDGADGVGVGTDSCVGAVFGFVVGEVPEVFVGAIVALATGGIAVDTVPFFVVAAIFGAQAVSIRVRTNTAPMGNLVFISILSFSGMILAFSINIYAVEIGFGFSSFDNQKYKK